MSRSVLVFGDSVAAGYGTDDSPAWPHRLPDTLGEPLSVTVRGGVGTKLTEHAAGTGDGGDLDGALAAAAAAGGSGGVTVLVHAGHNDAQVGGDGDPRVSTDAFRTAAARLDDALRADDRVARHAFVGLLPLLEIEGGVGFGAAQPDRGLAFDDALAATVDTHLPVAEPVEAWRDRTLDGVHPAPAGHEAVASAVADWLAGGP